MTEAVDAFNYDPEKNYDDDTMVQQRDIEKEIAAAQPPITGFFSFDDILEEYAKEDAVYRQKIEDLKMRYKCIRRIRGDGNCFFRGFGFAYLETLLKNAEEYKRFTDIVKKSKDELVALGFPQFTLEDFHDTFMDIVKQVENPGTVDKLLETFNEQGLSDYFVVYLRLLVSGHLQGNEESYLPFIDGGRTVKEFCGQTTLYLQGVSWPAPCPAVLKTELENFGSGRNDKQLVFDHNNIYCCLDVKPLSYKTTEQILPHKEVEPMGKESDHIHIVSLCKALGVRVAIEYMDRGGSKCTAHQFSSSDTDEAEGQMPTLTLLYRPGHYDIIYPL